MRIKEKDYAIGADTLAFEMVIGGADEGVSLDWTSLIGDYGRDFGKVKVDKGKIHIRLNLPKLVRENNTMPFSVVDFIMLESIRNDIKQALEEALEGKLDGEIDVWAATAKSIECNLTSQTAGYSTCSQVLNAIHRSYYEGTNVVFQRASAKCQYDKENETVIVTKKNCYALKSYDKTLEQRKKGNKEVEADLLRIEVVMQARTIQKLFGKNSTIRDVLTEQGLAKIIKEYKRIFREDVIKGHIVPCLNNVSDILFASLKKTDRRIETIARWKELVVDEEVLRRALVKWYRHQGYDQERAKRNADTYVCRCRAKYGFPRDVISTFRHFKKLCE